MPDVRPATAADVDLLTRIASEGFYDDPVMSWAMPDDDRRLGQLTVIFRGMVTDVLGRGRTYLADDASACFWRDPAFDHHAPSPDDDTDPEAWGAFPGDDLERLGVLDAAMHEAHPRDPHWYLNVVSTLPEHRSKGLGAAVLAPIIAEADAAGQACYLESTNPRNRTLYYRHGFDDMGDIHLDDGVSMRQMWRLPRSG